MRGEIIKSVTKEYYVIGKRINGKVVYFSDYTVNDNSNIVDAEFSEDNENSLWYRDIKYADKVLTELNEFKNDNNFICKVEKTTSIIEI